MRSLLGVSPRGRRGATLTEMMVATVLLSVGILGLFSSFRYIAKSIFVSRAQSLATNLAQERIETLKNLNYYALQLTTATGTDASFSPALQYDTAVYTPESIAIGGITFTRYTYVNMAELNNGDINEVASSFPDTGLKEITVHVVWTDAGSKKKWSLRNLLENPNVNPLDSTIAGTISNAAGGVVASAIVQVEQNEDWSAQTNSVGYYSFQVYHGTYTVRASSYGFTDVTSPSTVVSRGQTTTVNLSLTAVASGTVSGEAWYNTHLVVSQVVAATSTQTHDLATHEIEYVELFNPTTFPIDIGTTGQNQKNVMMTWYNEDGSYRYDSSGYTAATRFDMVDVTTYVAPNHYYLIANATSFLIGGQWVNADAYYDSSLTYPDRILNDKGGSIALWSWPLSTWIDIVGWADVDNSPCCGLYETTYIPNLTGHDGIGDPVGKQLVRVSSPTASTAANTSYGRAYETNDNSKNFTYTDVPAAGSFIVPRSMNSSSFTVITGMPAVGAYISASDSNSGSTQAYTATVSSGSLSLSVARFRLTGVSTGTWSVTLALNGYTQVIDTVAVSQGTDTPIPNATSSPTWAANGLYHVELTSSITGGYVKGVVTNTSNTPLNGITVSGGGSSKTTGNNGTYFLTASTGAVTVVANANNASNSSYVQNIQNVTVTQGNVTTQDFSLLLGGRLYGYVTTGTTPLPNLPVTATNGGGGQSGAGTTDSSGHFTMRNISTGTYTVFPVLETGQDASPNTIDVTLASTGTVFVGTFTLTGAYGNIAGTVSDASGLITSGALLLASTATIPSTPAAVVGSSAPSQTPMYMISSSADGTYTLPVRGSNTYYLSAYVPSISNLGVVSITTKTYSNIYVSPSASTTKNVSIP